MSRANMDEMDVEAVDLGHELRQRVELRLALPPVVVRPPIARDFLDRGELYALGVVQDGLTIGPARRRDAPAEIDQRILWNVNLERPDCVSARAFGGCVSSARKSARGAGSRGGNNEITSRGFRERFGHCCPPRAI